MNKILYFSVFAFLYFFTSTKEVLASASDEYSSAVLDEGNQVRTNFTVESFFKEEALISEVKNDALMQVVAGLRAKRIGNNQKAKEHLYRAARLKNQRGMIELSHVYYAEGALEESMRWATLAYNVENSVTGNPYKEALEFFAKVRQDLAAEKKENFKSKHRFSDSKQKKRAVYDFLHRTSLLTDIYYSSILWALTSEPFYDQKLSKSKSIYLFGLKDNLPEQTVRCYLSSCNAVNLEKLMQLAQEVVLSKGGSEQQGLILLADMLKKKGDERFFSVLKKANTPESLLHCGFHLERKGYKLKRTDLKYTALLKDAIRMYERSGTSKANERIGSIYMIHLCEEPDAYKKAYQALMHSDTATALLNLVEIIRYGYHGEEPDVEKAKEMLLSLQERLESDPGSKDAKEVLLDLYNNLGSIFQGAGDLETAIEYYKKSGTENALNSLICIFKSQGTGGEFLELLKKSGSVSSQLNVNHYLYSNKRMTKAEYLNSLKELSTQNPTPEEIGYLLVGIGSVTGVESRLYQEAKQKFLSVSHFVVETEKLITLSKVDIFEGKYDRARLYLSKLVLGASAEAILILEDLDRIEKEEAYKVELSDFFMRTEGLLREIISKRKEVSSGEESSSSEEEESEDEAVPCEKVAASSSSAKASPPKLSRAKKRAIKEAKLAEKAIKVQERTQRRIEWRVQEGVLVLASVESRETLSDITYVFADGAGMRGAFNVLQENSVKFRELLTDIREQPWATTGSGKPEVLKGVYMGHRGCISRRLNHEDRFVYKVTGPGEILVLSLEGHYR